MSDVADSPKVGKLRRLLVRAVVFAGGILLIIGFCAAAWTWHAYSAAKRDLAREVALVRERGAPLTTIELQQLYKPESGLTDVTVELERILLIADRPELQEKLKELRPLLHSSTPPATGQPWPELPEVVKFLEQHDELLAFAQTLQDRECTARFSCDLTLGVAAPTPHIYRLVGCAQVLSLQVRVDLYHERFDDAANRILQELALASTLRNEPSMISQMIRTVIMRAAIKDVEVTLAHPEVSHDDLVQLQTAFRKFDAHSAQQLVIRAERACMYTACTWPVETLAEEDSNSQMNSKDYVESHLAAGPKIPWDAALLLTFYRRLEDAAEVSVYATKQECDAVDKDFKSYFRTRSKLRRYPYTSLAIPGSLFGIGRFVHADAQCQSAETAIACLRFQRTHQRLPTKLDELVPAFLPTVPQDPYSGKSLLLGATDESLKVYSVGVNGIDDGGSWGGGDFADVGIAIETK